MHLPDNHYFITVDAESDCIAEGVDKLSSVRDEVERETGKRIPITWFVRMQRTLQEYIHEDSPSYFCSAVEEGFDGFRLAKTQLTRALERGDEIGWHYHAYSYVHRDDLGHEHKVSIVANDLAACAREIGRRHPEFPIRSFRWGWYFVPDYGLCRALQKIGIDVDASVAPHKDGKPVASFSTTYLPSITTTPAKMDGTHFFPIRYTRLVHDWEVVAHEFSWNRVDEAEAFANLEQYRNMLRQLSGRLEESGGVFITYGSAAS